MHRGLVERGLENEIHGAEGGVRAGSAGLPSPRQGQGCVGKDHGAGRRPGFHWNPSHHASAQALPSQKPSRQAWPSHHPLHQRPWPSLNPPGMPGVRFSVAGRTGSLPVGMRRCERGVLVSSQPRWQRESGSCGAVGQLRRLTVPEGSLQADGLDAVCRSPRGRGRRRTGLGQVQEKQSTVPGPHSLVRHVHSGATLPSKAVPGCWDPLITPPEAFTPAPPIEPAGPPEAQIVVKAPGCARRNGSFSLRRSLHGPAHTFLQVI